jgi:hypothetical protein
VLFATQLVFTSPTMRYAYTALYILLTLGRIVLGGAAQRRALRALPGFLFER